MGVVVLGMHRSGTSASAGVLASIGLESPDPEHRLPPTPANPKGYFENAHLVELDERILQHFGGEWSAPPPLPSGWETSPTLGPVRQEARSVFRDTMPSSGWVFKDPRLCLVLPFWTSVVSDFLAILVHREPAAVVRSLAYRDNLPAPLILALWERYTRDALANLAGHRTLVACYSDLVAHPFDFLDVVRNALPPATATRAEIDRTLVARFIDPGMDSGPGDEPVDALMSPAQHALLDIVHGLLGTHHAFPEVTLPDQTAWAQLLIEQRREFLRLAHDHHLLGLNYQRAVAATPLWVRKYRAVARRLRGGADR